jgi:hypothetical protein
MEFYFSDEKEIKKTFGNKVNNQDKMWAYCGVPAVLQKISAIKSYEGLVISINDMFHIVRPEFWINFSVI